MSTVSPELERVIRDALHREQITAAELLQPTLRQPRPRPGRLFAVVAAAAAVAIVAAVLAVFAARGNRTNNPAAGDSLAGVVGFRWQVTHLVDARGGLDVPASLHAEMGFTRDGYVLGDDSVNTMSVQYTATEDGYSVGPAGSSLVGYAGSPGSVQTRTKDAVDALFFDLSSSVIRNSSPFTVTVTLDDQGVLTLEHADTQLTLARIGPQPDFAQPASPTATASR